MKKKILVACLCVALAVLTVAGTTLAYLTSKDEVTNTFTVGNVAITLDEAKVNTDGTTVEGAARVKANTYKLMPGHSYTKDPTVHVAAGSEDCWVFVKVVNGLAAYESTDADYTKIANQIVSSTNGWAELTGVTGVTGVYYQKVTDVAADKATDLKVFENFKLADNANTVAGWSTIGTLVKEGSPDKVGDIVVTAYAIQADGITTAADAWSKLNSTTSGN